MTVINMEKARHAQVADTHPKLFQADTKKAMSWEKRLLTMQPSRLLARSQLRESQSLVKGLHLVRRAGNWPKVMNYSEFFLN